MGVREHFQVVFDRWNRGDLATFFVIVWCIATDAGPANISLRFHDSALVNDTLFSVGDIAQVTGGDGAVNGAVTECIAGTCAPPGYGRFITAADLVSFNLRVKFPDVIFTHAGSKRPLVRTDYRVVKLSDHETALRSWIASTIGWNEGEWEVTIDNLADSCKLLDKPISLSFCGLEQRFPKGSANLSLVAQQGSYIGRIPIKCHFSVITPVVVTLNAVARGEMLTPEDCEIRRMDITRFSPSPYRSLSALQNKRAARSINPGTIVHDRLLLTVPVIEKGDAVSIIYKNGRISIAVSGIARERGGIGDRIWVENQQTHKLIRTEIREKGIVSPLQGGVSI